MEMLAEGFCSVVFSPWFQEERRDFVADCKKRMQAASPHGYARSIRALGNRPPLTDRLEEIRTRTLIDEADLVVVRFGDKYRQWNAAFDAGYASARGKPVITLHDAGLTHALKEVDAAALAVAETPDQVVALLRYTIRAELPEA